MQRTSPRWIAFVLAVLALAAWAWAALDGRFRDAEGFASTRALWPLAIGAALLVLAAAARGGWLAAGGWLALGLYGHAALLGLLVAGSDVGYANLSLTADGALKRAPLIVLGAQALLVLLGAWKARRELWAGLRARLGAGRAVLFAALGAATCLAFFTDVPSWLAKSCFLAALHLVALANLVLAARALPADVLGRWRAAFARALGPETGAPKPGAFSDAFSRRLAALVVAITGLLAVFVYERHPHVPDELVYLMHAEYLAQGRLALPPPPVPAAFDVDLMLLDEEAGRWFCPVPIGWPAVLALGELAGAPWLVNPLLTGAGVLLAYALLRELVERRTARLVTLLLAASPWTLFLGMSFMPHPLTLAAALLAALGVARAQRRAPRSTAWAWSAGGALGVVALIRPLEGLVWAALLGLWALGLGGRRVAPGALAGLVLGAVLVGGSTLPYNAALTGSASKFPIMEYVDRVYGPGKNDLGFGDERGLAWGGLDPFPGHHLRDALVNAQFNLSAIDLELLGWGLGSLAPLFYLLLRGGLRRPERLALAAAGLVVLAHAFYWFSGGPDFGARYWHLVIVPCLVLAARGLAVLGAPSGAGAAMEREELRPTRVLAAALAATALGLAVHVPWRVLDRYHHYRGMRPDVRTLAEERDFGRSLVLVRGRRHPDYASAAVLNGSDLERDGPVYAWDKSAETRAALLAHYADRPVWLLDGPTVTGRGFEVAAGPLEPLEAARRQFVPARAPAPAPRIGEGAHAGQRGADGEERP